MDLNELYSENNGLHLNSDPNVLLPDSGIYGALPRQFCSNDQACCLNSQIYLVLQHLLDQPKPHAPADLLVYLLPACVTAGWSSSFVFYNLDTIQNVKKICGFMLQRENNKPSILPQSILSQTFQLSNLPQPLRP